MKMNTKIEVVGKALLQYLAPLALEHDCGRLVWAVLERNEPVIKFYEFIDARIMKNGLMNRIAEEKLVALSSES